MLHLVTALTCFCIFVPSLHPYNSVELFIKLILVSLKLECTHSIYPSTGVESACMLGRILEMHTIAA